jgi:hypothetical protein
MARVAKGTTTLRRQAWLAASGTFLVWLLAVVAAFWVLLWGLWHHLASSFVVMVLAVAFLAVALVLMDWSLIPIRGYLGERRVRGELAQLPDEYWILHDVRPNSGGKTAQIDHVLVSPHGMWCIETKSRLGWIFGQRGDRTWTQVKESERGGRHTRQMENAVRQNEWQRSQLDAYLKERLDFWCPVKCLVVFTAGRMMKDVQNVIRVEDVCLEVQRADTKTWLNEAQIRRVVEALLPDGR